MSEPDVRAQEQPGLSLGPRVKALPREELQ